MGVFTLRFDTENALLYYSHNWTYTLAEYIYIHLISVKGEIIQHKNKNQSQSKYTQCGNTHMMFDTPNTT
jgi:hypothetical protein